ncbi:MAG: hypothetical protein NC210_04310 [[Clostridium] fimetarium]|nr:hypothetical protein [Alistipes timonensis]MCM1405626.1 hypothetical protein [[Clostridium] fimetarium]
MTEEELKRLAADTDGLASYEHIANHIGTIDDEDLARVIDRLEQVDINGQFAVSAARYLFATDSERFASAVNRLIAIGIEKDRDRSYIGSLLQSVYGADYAERAAELSASDDNFRRIYKRLFNQSPI